MSTVAQPQHLLALERANAIYRHGLAVLRELRAAPDHRTSCNRAAELLRDPPESIARMRLGRFLTAVHGFAAYRARRLISDVGLPYSAWERRIGHGGYDHEIPLTRRQREALAAELEAAA